MSPEDASANSNTTRDGAPQLRRIRFAGVLVHRSVRRLDCGRGHRQVCGGAAWRSLEGMADAASHSNLSWKRHILSFEREPRTCESRSADRRGHQGVHGNDALFLPHAAQQQLRDRCRSSLRLRFFTPRAGSYITLCLGRPLVELNYDKLDKEASFREALIHVRENAESILLGRQKGRLNACSSGSGTSSKTFDGSQQSIATSGFSRPATIGSYKSCPP